MRPQLRPLIVTIGLSLLSGQLQSAPSLLHETIGQPTGATGTPWAADKGNPGAGSDLSTNNAAAYGTANSFGLVTSILGTRSNPSEASVRGYGSTTLNFDKYTTEQTFSGTAFITFSAQRTRGSEWTNIKFINTNGGASFANSQGPLGIGSVGGTPGTNNWGVGIGQSGDAPFGSISSLAGAVNTASHFLLRIDYSANTSDRISIWSRTSGSFGTEVTSSDPFGKAVASLTGVDLRFDTIAIYAGTNSTFAVSNIDITFVPEPATAALTLGAGMLALVGYRRCRSRKTA